MKNSPIVSVTSAGRRSSNIWRWLLTVTAAVFLIGASVATYYVVNPHDFGNSASMAAYDAVIFPLIFLISMVVAAALAAVASFSKAKLAGVGFGLAAILMLSMAAWSAIGMWSLARKENVGWLHILASRHT
jgi:hypothetical protein